MKVIKSVSFSFHQVCLDSSAVLTKSVSVDRFTVGWGRLCMEKKDSDRNRLIYTNQRST